MIYTLNHAFLFIVYQTRVEFVKINFIKYNKLVYLKVKSDIIYVIGYIFNEYDLEILTIDNKKKKSLVQFYKIYSNIMIYDKIMLYIIAISH